MAENTPSPLGNVISIDDERIKDHLDRAVRGTVEETLNALLDAEADRLCNAQRYERSEARRDTRAGHYERNLQTKAGEVRLRVPKLRQQTFETAIIERYRRRESSVEEALIEMYLAGVIGASGRGHHRGLMGYAGVARDGIGPEQEDLCNHRGLA
jgi:putative transposase